MRMLLLVPGIALLVVAHVEVLVTTLWPEAGGGPVTRRVAGNIWRGTRRLAEATGRVAAWQPSVGPLTVIATLLGWVAMLFVAWVLIFTAGPHGLVSTGTLVPADLAERFYYVGYSVFTLGNGDFRPQGAPWQLATVAMSASGLILITLAITYLLPVVSAARAKRTLAGLITALGSSPDDLLEVGWDGDRFSPLDLQLVTISSDIGTLADQHLTYPVLHYFHTDDERRSSALAIAVLDEALTVLAHGVPLQHQPTRPVLHAARQAVESYLETLTAGYIQPADDVPPVPGLHGLRAAGVPVIDDGAFGAAVEQEHQRRRLLLALVRASGWAWDDVLPKKVGRPA